MRPDRRSGSTDPVGERTSQRDRAMRRLSRLTTATAVAGTVATVGFGGLAAVTYSGTTTPAEQTIDDSASSQNSTGTDGTTEQYNAGGSAPSAGATQRPLETVVPGYGSQPAPVQPPTRSRGHSHVSSGGSG